MDPFDLKMKGRVKQFLFGRQAWYAPHHDSRYLHHPEELRAIKRRYRKILKRARSKIGPGLGDYHTIYLAYGLHKQKNVYEGWKRNPDGSWQARAAEV
jgi:hypothetical protein